MLFRSTCGSGGPSTLVARLSLVFADQRRNWSTGGGCSVYVESLPPGKRRGREQQAAARAVVISEDISVPCLPVLSSQLPTFRYACDFTIPDVCVRFQPFPRSQFARGGIPGAIECGEIERDQFAAGSKDSQNQLYPGADAVNQFF